MTRIFLHVYHIEKKLVYNVSFDNMPDVSLGDDVQRIKNVGRTSEGLKNTIDYGCLS